MQLTKMLVSKSAPWMLVALCACACVPRQRFNKACEWTGDAPVRLDLDKRSDRRHLVQDAQLAEELAVRYADFQHAKANGYEGHGGYVDGGRAGYDCLAKLLGAIEDAHGVRGDQVFDARRHRDWWFDAGVVVSFGVIYVIASALGARFIARRMPLHDTPVWVVATVVASLVAAAAGVQLLSMWATVAEMLRVGNDHLGVNMRAAVSPWMQPGRRILASAIVLFWASAWPATRGLKHGSGGSESGLPIS